MSSFNFISDTEFQESIYHNYGLTTPNASRIEIHVNCLTSTGRVYFFLPSQPCSVAYHDKAGAVLFNRAYTLEISCRSF